MEWLLIGRWLVALGALTVAGAPLSAWLFPRLPRRGAAFSLPVSLLGLATVVFLVGQVTFGIHTVVIGVLAVAGASALAYRDGARPDWTAVRRSFPVFVAGFLLLVAFRVSRPTLTPVAGEQFLHFALVKSLARAPHLPPEDVWFAGEPLRYYYGTQLQVTSLSMLTGTELRYGFNLAIAVFYGVLAVSAYGLAGAVAAARGRSYRAAGALGAFFAAVAGPLTTAIRVVFGLLPDDVAVAYGHAVFGFAARRSGDTYPQMVAGMSNLDSWTWWYTRYVVPGTLQEVPLYSFVKADLHGHALSTGYVVVAAALAFSYYRLPAQRRGRRLAVLGALGVVAGVFGFMNTWALPTAAGLAWLAVASADAHPASLLPDPLARALGGPGSDGTPVEPDGNDALTRVGAEAWRLVLAAVPAVGVGLVGVAVASPFLLSGLVPENGGVGLLPPRSPLAEFLVVYGALLALVAGYLWVRGRQGLVGSTRRRGVALGVGVAVVVVVPAVGWALDVTVAVLLGTLSLGAWWLVRTDRGGFEAVLLVAGLGLLLALEVVFAKVAPWPDGPARWNTSLKVAVQGWTLAAVGAGVVAADLLADGRRALAERRATGRVGDAARAGRDATNGRLLAGGLAAAVVLASLAFPLLTAGLEVGGAVTDGSGFTLDGLAAHEQRHPGEMPAIRWLDAREGRPVVVESPGRAYEWSSRAATLTGLPGVLGWRHHQENYRPDERVARRVAAIDRIYTGDRRAAARALARYDVTFVYVGPAERDRYGDALRPLGSDPALEPVVETGTTTVYRVNRTELGS